MGRVIAAVRGWLRFDLTPEPVKAEVTERLKEQTRRLEAVRPAYSQYGDRMYDRRSRPR